MELQEQKQIPKGGLSGGVKALIGLAVVLALLAGGFFAYKSSRDYANERDYVLSTLYQVDPYDSEELQNTAERVQPLLEKKKFQNDLAELVTELAEVGFANLESDLAGKSSSERPGTDRYENAYGISSYENKLCGIITVLHLTGYEDQRILDTVSDLFTREKDLLTGASASDPKTAFDIAKAMDSAGRYINLWNDVSTDFYHIDNVYTLQEVRDRFTQAARGYLEAGNTAGLTKVLSTPMEFAGEGGGPAGAGAPAEAAPADAPYSGPAPYLEPQEIFDALSGGSKDLFTLLKNRGGYYDAPNAMPGTKYDDPSNCYGDFYYESHQRGGKTYDMTEFNANPGLWDSIGSSMQAFITDSNNRANERITNCYFRGEDFGKVDIPEWADQGFQYGVHTEDGSFVFVSPNGITTGGDIISGDFSAVFQDLKSRYGATGPDGGTVLPLSQQLANPDPALAPYVPFCGTFTSENGGRFLSDFSLRNGQVYWQASSAWTDGELPFTFIVDHDYEGEVTYNLLVDPYPVNNMTVEQAYDLVAIRALTDEQLAMGAFDPEEPVDVPPSDGMNAARLTFQEDGTIRYDLGRYNSITELSDNITKKEGFVSQVSFTYTKES